MTSRPLLLRLRARLSLALPRGWRDAVLQVALWGLADLLYEGVRGLVAGRGDAALANAHAVVAFERATGLFFEPQLQRLVLGNHDLVVASNWLYVNIQFTVNALFLAFLYIYRNQIFYFVRNMFFVAMGMALVVHLIVPVAPPRMLPQLGFVDTIHQIAHINQDSGAVSLFVNPYAAVPSMHMCFALLIGITAVVLTRRRWLKLVWLVYPALVLGVIVVTANHFVFDALTGAVTAAVAFLAAKQVMARVRPAAWAWAPVGRRRVGSSAPAMAAAGAGQTGPGRS